MAKFIPALQAHLSIIQGQSHEIYQLRYYGKIHPPTPGTPVNNTGTVSRDLSVEGLWKNIRQGWEIYNIITKYEQ